MAIKENNRFPYVLSYSLLKMYLPMLYVLLSVGLVTMPSCSEAVENLLLVFCWGMMTGLFLRPSLPPSSSLELLHDESYNIDREDGSLLLLLTSCILC